jgi:DNA-binding transcriptional regulator YhcF (GntR family)
MKFWLSKNSEISLREQLARQIMLAIVAGDLRPNERLPSVREMALRHKIHPNTVSAAYVSLQENGWIDTRKGSGAFVCEKSIGEIETAASDSQGELDRIISQFLRHARTQGFSRAQIAERLKTKLAQNDFSEIVLVESDAELRNILAFEIKSAIDLPISETDLESFTERRGAIVAALEGTASKLPKDLIKIELKLNSAQNEMSGRVRPAADEIIGIASGCEMFLVFSQTMLVAAGLEPEQIVVRDARLENWQKGLNQCAFVIADSLTAEELPEEGTRIFRLISKHSLAELETLLD